MAPDQELVDCVGDYAEVPVLRGKDGVSNLVGVEAVSCCPGAMVPISIVTAAASASSLPVFAAVLLLADYVRVNGWVQLSRSLGGSRPRRGRGLYVE